VVRKQWKGLARERRPLTNLVEKRLAAAASKRLLRKFVGSSAGKVLVVVDVGANAYLIYDDFMRWDRSEISGGYFGLKAGLHSAQIALTVYAFWAPDPTFVSKLVAGGGALLLTVAGAVSDPLYAAAQERTSQLLRELEREERYNYCRRQILADMQRAIEVSQ